MSETLKPCPFCGEPPASPERTPNKEDWFISCQDCGACEVLSSDRLDCIAAWNRRAPSPVPASPEVEELDDEQAARYWWNKCGELEKEVRRLRAEAGKARAVVEAARRYVAAREIKNPTEARDVQFLRMAKLEEALAAHDAAATGEDK